MGLEVRLFIKWGLQEARQGIDPGIVFKFRLPDGQFAQVVAQNVFRVGFEHQIGCLCTAGGHEAL